MCYSSRWLGCLLAALALLPTTGQADNIFTLQVNAASANPNQLKPGDLLKLDVLFTSDGTTPIQGYQAAIGFDSTVFDPKSTGNGGIFTRNPASPFMLPGINGSVFANGSAGPRVFTGSESSATTAIFATTPTLLGTFNLSVLPTAAVGASDVRFSDLLSTPPANANRTNLLFTSGGASFKPTFQDGIVGVSIGQAAPVPEAGTALGLGLLLGAGSLTLGYKRNHPARKRRCC